MLPMPRQTTTVTMEINLRMEQVKFKKKESMYSDKKILAFVFDPLLDEKKGLKLIEIDINEQTKINNNLKSLSASHRAFKQKIKCLHELQTMDVIVLSRQWKNVLNTSLPLEHNYQTKHVKPLNVTFAVFDTDDLPRGIVRRALRAVREKTDPDAILDDKAGRKDDFFSLEGAIKYTYTQDLKKKLHLKLRTRGLSVFSDSFCIMLFDYFFSFFFLFRLRTGHYATVNSIASFGDFAVSLAASACGQAQPNAASNSEKLSDEDCLVYDALREDKTPQIHISHSPTTWARTRAFTRVDMEVNKARAASIK